MSVGVLKSVFGVGSWLLDCATICFCYTAGCTAVTVATEYAFIYVFVSPKACHTFFFNTSLSLYKISAVHYITCNALLLSLPSINFLSVTPFHPAVWHNNCHLLKISSHSGRWPSPCKFLHCWFSQMTGTTHMFYWLHRVWLLVVASAVIQATIRLLVVTKCLSCLDRVNYKFSITHSASNWTFSAMDVYGTE